MIIVACEEIDRDYPNHSPLYSVNLTLDEIKTIQKLTYCYDLASVRGGHGFHLVMNYIYNRLIALFPKLNKGLGYRLCGYGNVKGDFRTLLQDKTGLFRRLLGVLSAVHKLDIRALKQIEAAAQAEAERLAQDAAKLAAEAAVAKHLSEIAAQHVHQAAVQQIEMQTTQHETEQLLEQLITQEAQAQHTATTATEQVALLEAKELVLQKKIQAEKAQQKLNYPLSVYPDIPGHTNARELAAHAATKHANMQLTAEIETKQAIQETILLVKERLGAFLEAKEVTNIVFQQITQEAEQLAQQAIVAQQLADIATSKLSAVASRITPAYHRKIQQEAVLAAQTIEAQALAQIGNIPAKKELDLITQRITELADRTIASQRKCQQAREKASELSEQASDADKAGDMTAQNAARELAAKKSPHEGIDPWHVSASIAISKAQGYLNALNILMKESRIKKAQQADNPTASAFAMQMSPKLVELRLVTQEAFIAIFQGTEQEPERSRLRDAYSVANINYHATLIKAYQTVCLFEAQQTVMLATQEVSQLIEKLADTQTMSPQHISELSSHLNEAQKKQQAATQEVTRLINQETKAKQIADKTLEKLQQTPSFINLTQTNPDRAAESLIHHQRHEYWKALEALIDKHTLDQETHLAEEKALRDKSHPVNNPLSIQMIADASASSAKTARPIHRFVSLDLIFKYGVNAISLPDHPIFYLTDPAMSPATKLFFLDLIAVLVMHGPECRFNQFANQNEQSRYCIQRFYSDSTRYQQSLSRVSAYFNDSSLQTDSSQKTAIDLNIETAFAMTNPALQIASKALKGLQSKMMGTHPSFFTPSIQTMASSIASLSVQEKALAIGTEQIEQVIHLINPKTLDAKVCTEITALSTVLHTTKTVQQIRSTKP